MCPLSNADFTRLTSTRVCQTVLLLVGGTFTIMYNSGFGKSGELIPTSSKVAIV